MNVSDLKLRAHWLGGVLTFFEKSFGLQRGTSLWESCPMLAALCDPSYAHVFEDDFDRLPVDADHWTLTEDAGKTGTDAILDEVGGWLKNYCDGDDNDESYRISHGETWLFEADKPLWFEARVRLTEANTDDANWIIGLMDAAGANALKDDGGGAPDSYDGAVILKVDGTMTLQFETSNAAAQVTTANLGTFVSGVAYKVGFLFDPKDGVTGTITPYLEGVAGTPHNITLAGLEVMHLFWGVKAGDANEEAIEVDRIKVFQIR